jgi:hypothetical protein
MLSQDAYKKIVRLSATYDLIVTAPFMTPWTLVLMLGLFDQLHLWFGLPGQIPAFETTHLLFAGLMGSVVVVWSLARLRLNLAVLGRYDALARFCFASWQIFAVANGATPLLLAFTAFEIGFGVAQALPHGGSPTPISGALTTQS